VRYKFILLLSSATVDPQKNISDTHLSSKPGPAAIGPSTRSSILPAAPDRSTKPVSAASLSSDVNAHAAKLEKEQAELIQPQTMQNAAALANPMLEKRKLEQEMDKKKEQIDSQSAAELVEHCTVAALILHEGGYDFVCLSFC